MEPLSGGGEHSKGSCRFGDQQRSEPCACHFFSTLLELLEEYNVDVIPYRVVNGSHQDLLEQLRLYTTFVLTRPLHFGRQARVCPEYDSETTALLTYNRLALSDGARITADVLGSLLRARLLASLKTVPSRTLDELTRDLLERTEILTHQFPKEATLLQSYDRALSMISTAVMELVRGGLVAVIEEESTITFALTNLGRSLVGEQSAHSSLLEDKFSESLSARARQRTTDEDKGARVAKGARIFLMECVTKRALGVAMAWHAPSTDFQRFHMVALLQDLPRHLEEVATVDEARHLVGLITDVLARPTPEEAQYLALLLQSRFGLHLLGFDPDATSARLKELSETAFILDATTLIPFLGRSSVGHLAARQLVDEIRRVDAAVATTDLLAEEVAEHAQWALRQLGAGADISSVRGLAAAIGKAGAKTNVFIEGCITEAEAGRPLDFVRYLDSVCGSPAGHTASLQVFQAALSSAGLPCPQFSSWDGFENSLWAERDAIRLTSNSVG